MIKFLKIIKKWFFGSIIEKLTFYGNFVSETAQGYSVDNIAPGTPQDLIAEGIESGIYLSWNSNSEVDLGYYAIYKSTNENFDPSTEEPAFTTTENMIIDTDVEFEVIYYYSISAFDDNGNESPYSVIVDNTPLSLSEIDIPGNFSL